MCRIALSCLQELLGAPLALLAPARRQSFVKCDASALAGKLDNYLSGKATPVASPAKPSSTKACLSAGDGGEQIPAIPPTKLKFAA